MHEIFLENHFQAPHWGATKSPENNPKNNPKPNAYLKILCSNPITSPRCSPIQGDSKKVSFIQVGAMEWMIFTDEVQKNTISSMHNFHKKGPHFSFYTFPESPSRALRRGSIQNPKPQTLKKSDHKVNGSQTANNSKTTNFL